MSAKISWSCSRESRPGSKGFRSNNSPRIHPIDHISIAAVYYFVAKSASGARYHRVAT